jgi:hypothetical protein
MRSAAQAARRIRLTIVQLCLMALIPGAVAQSEPPGGPEQNRPSRLPRPVRERIQNRADSAKAAEESANAAERTASAAQSDQPIAPKARSRPTPRPVRFDATVYCISLAPDQIAHLEATTLEQAKSIAEFDTQLRAVGESRLLHRVQQNIDLITGAKVETAADVPYVAGTQTTKDGQQATSISRDNQGATFQVGASLDPESAEPSNIHTRVDIEMSYSRPSDVGVGSDEFAPVFMRIRQSHCGPLVPGDPVVLITADASAIDHRGLAAVYVTRLVFQKP